MASVSPAAPTASIKSVTRVRVFQENWSEDRIAVETPAGQPQALLAPEADLAAAKAVEITVTPSVTVTETPTAMPTVAAKVAGACADCPGAKVEAG